MVLLRHFLRLQPYIWTQQKSINTAQSALFAGHSKWANIRHIKAQKDGEKSALFTRVARQIRIAIQEGGSSDPNINSSLRSVIDEGLRKNMPIASIQSTIKKCQQSQLELKKYTLEMRYKHNVFMIVTLFTDNFTQTKQEMATILRKNSATFANVASLFDDIGLIESTLENPQVNNLEDQATDDAIDCGAEDVEVFDKKLGIVHFFCSPNEINRVRNSIEAKNYKIDSSNHVYTAKNTIALTDEELKAYLTFTDKLRNLNGVEDIFDNVDQSDAS